MIPVRTAVVTLMLAVVVAGCGGTGTTPRSDGAISPPVAPALPERLDMAAPGILDITAMPTPDWITVANGVAWVANVDHGIARFRRDGHKLGVIRTQSEVCQAMGQGFGSVWAVDCYARQLIRMDARSGALQKRIALTGITPPPDASIAVGPEGVFLLDGDTAIVRVDPGTNRVIDKRIPFNFAGSVTVGYGSLWVTCPGTGVVSRLDPATGAVQAEIPTKVGVHFVTTGAGALWTLNYAEGSVDRIDPSTNKLVKTIDTGQLVDFGDLTFGHGSVWARVTDALVVRIDAQTNKVVQRYGESSGPGGVAADDTTLWISARQKLTVWRVPLD